MLRHPAGVCGFIISRTTLGWWPITAALRHKDGSGIEENKQWETQATTANVQDHCGLITQQYADMVKEKEASVDSEAGGAAKKLTRLQTETASAIAAQDAALARRSWRESIELLLGETLDEERAEALMEQFHIRGRTAGELTQQDQVIAAMLKKAQEGNKDAAVFLRDTVGQAPAQAMKLGALDVPFERLDLTQLSDEELRQLAEREKPEEDQEGS